MNSGATPDAGQQWDPEVYDRNARFVSTLAGPLVGMLAPTGGERILDLGCGDGHLTRVLAETGATIVGVDASPAMVDKARELGLDARLMDARSLTFEREFDAVFSNAALHWVPDLDAAMDGIARALKPGGRLVGEMGGHGNVAAICTALRAVLTARGVAAPNPYSFPAISEFSELLIRHGLSAKSIELIPRPTPLPTGMAGWLVTFAQPFLNALPEKERETAIKDTVKLLRPALCDAGGEWTADYVRLRFRAVKPG